MTVQMKGNCMKKMILAITTLALAGASVQNAAAGDREWATAGKVLTGILAAKVVTQAFQPPPVYTYQPAPVYSYQTSAVYGPAPTVVAAAPTVAPAPVVQTTVVQPAGTVVYQTAAPVYYESAPVVVYRPAYCAPAPYYYGPSVSIGFGFGGSRYGSHHRGGRW